MPCNLAVSITKAAVTPDHLRDLVTPDVIQTVLTSFLADQYLNLAVQFQRWGDDLLIELIPTVNQARSPRFTVTISKDWSVTATASAFGYTTMGDEEQAARFADDITQLLARTADAVFARRVQGAMANLGGQMAIETVLVEEAGQSATATLMTITL